MTLCTGQLSLGNAGFMSFGAYTSAIVTMHAGVPMRWGSSWEAHGSLHCLNYRDPTTRSAVFIWRLQHWDLEK